LATENGDISYITLNGETRKIAGSTVGDQLQQTISNQDALISQLQSETENLKIQLQATEEKLTSLVSGMKNSSMITQTADGVYVGIKKTNYSLILKKQIKDSKNCIVVNLYADGEKVNGTTAFYAKVYGVTDETTIAIPNEQIVYYIINGELTFYYDDIYSSILIMVYDTDECTSLLCSNSINVQSPDEPAQPQGVYNIVLSCDSGLFLKDNGPTNLTIRARITRNGTDVTNSIMDYCSQNNLNFAFVLSWVVKDGTSTKAVSNSSYVGEWIIDKTTLGSESPTFSCQIDLPISILEQGGIFNDAII
jgi:hypothetical protein